MIWAALRLYQATNDPAYLAAAERWCATLDKHFWVADAGGYAFTADDTSDVIVRMRGAHDDATPNANAVMISNLAALHLLTGKAEYLDARQRHPRSLRPRPRQEPARPLRPPRQHLRPHRPPARGGDPDRRCGRLRQARPRDVPALPPRRRAAGGWRDGAPQPPAPSPARPPSDGKPTAYACLGPQCSLPVTEADALLELLREQRAPCAFRPALWQTASRPCSPS